MHRFELRVRYGDTDPMGWVYYGNYLRWFEVGRAEMLRSLGRTYRSIEEDAGVLMPVLEARCRYFHGARYDELVCIETGLLATTRATMSFGYRVVGEDGERCAIGHTEHCFTNRAAKLVRPPIELTSLLDRAPRVDAELAAELGVTR
jgi:acyl-CoA thioester hydrolase